MNTSKRTFRQKLAATGASAALIVGIAATGAVVSAPAAHAAGGYNQPGVISMTYCSRVYSSGLAIFYQSCQIKWNTFSKVWNGKRDGRHDRTCTYVQNNASIIGSCTGWTR